MEQNKDISKQISSDNQNYIWFGVYNELLSKANMIKLLDKCNDKSIPKESAAIHLNNYSLAFNKNKIFIKYNENSSIFIKLYLISKNQLIDILKTQYNCNEEIEKYSENIFKLQKINEEMLLEKYQTEVNFYNTIKNIGNLNEINIYSITTKNNIIDIQPPDQDYLNQIYLGLKESFYLYSDYLIIYYLYLIHEIKTTYSLKKLTEIFFQNHFKLKEENKNILNIKEIDNQKKLWYFLPKNDNKEEEKENINEYNFILDMDSLPEFDETTGEFFWNNSDSNWEKINKKINDSKEIKNKVVSVENGSIIKQFGNLDKNDNENNISEKEKNSLKTNILKYIGELSNILDTK